ncbi:hypothetical protein [Methanocaldococcus sp.]
MSNQDMGRGVIDLKNPSIINSEIAIDELDSLISEINTYIAELQYGLKTTNEKIAVVVVELYELEHILTKYMDYVDYIKVSLECSNRSINKVSMELLDVKQHATLFSNKIEERHKNIERKTNIFKKRLKYMDSLLNTFNNYQRIIKQELGIIEILTYLVVIMSFVGVIINLNKLF